VSQVVEWARTLVLHAQGANLLWRLPLAWGGVELVCLLFPQAQGRAGEQQALIEMPSEYDVVGKSDGKVRRGRVTPRDTSRGIIIALTYFSRVTQLEGYVWDTQSRTGNTADPSSRLFRVLAEVQGEVHNVPQIDYHNATLG